MSTLPTDASDFAARWNAYAARTGTPEKFPLLQFVINDPRLSAETVRFLAETGLPDDGDHYFDTCGKSIFEAWDGQADWEDRHHELFQPFLLLGMDCGGNLLCVDTANNDQIIVLDHEFSFEVPEFKNSSVRQFAECILIWCEIYEERDERQKIDVSMRSALFPRDLEQKHIERIRQIDPKVLTENRYWRYRVELLTQT